MRNRTVFLLVLLCTLQSAIAGVPIYQSSIVYQPSTGKVLLREKADRQLIPASLVKMMVALILMEQLADKEVALSDRYKVSAAASNIGGHQVYLKHGEVFKLGELLKAMMIGSANDAAYAIAEHLAGSEKAFVVLMNKKAKAMGLKKTRFVNAHGLPPGWRKQHLDNKTSAYDLAKIASELLRYPMITTLTSTRLDAFRGGTFQLLNTNREFLRTFPGADGLKTGYHGRGAGFSMVGTAKQGNERLIVVVMGAKRPSDRLKAATYLLKRGFSLLKKT